MSLYSSKSFPSVRRRGWLRHVQKARLDYLLHDGKRQTLIKIYYQVKQPNIFTTLFTSVQEAHFSGCPLNTAALVCCVYAGVLHWRESTVTSHRDQVSVNSHCLTSPPPHRTITEEYRQQSLWLQYD